MSQNLLLSVLPESERRRIAAHCETVALETRTMLCEADEPPAYAWFPESGVYSALVYARNGEGVEVGVIGREGMIGIPLILGEAANPFNVMVQMRGTAIRIAREPFVSDVLEPGHPFCDALLKYANLYLTSVAQTAMCNRLHRIEQRLARWLLDMHDRADTDALPMTHELLALMLGAYRPSITNALKTLQDRGVLRVARGRVDIVNEHGLETEACECHETIRRRTAATLRDIRHLAA